MPKLTNATCTQTFYLALAIWREARGEPQLGRTAVGYSILNRVARPSWWGRTVDEVITKKWQYSSLTDPRDKQLTRWPLLSDISWQECLGVAMQLLFPGVAAAPVDNPVPGADSYYDVSITAPKWTVTARKCGQVGRIIFYDVDHDYEKEEK